MNNFLISNCNIGICEFEVISLEALEMMGEKNLSGY